MSGADPGTVTSRSYRGHTQLEHSTGRPYVTITESYTDDSVTLFLETVADSLDRCADRATPSPWSLGQQQSWMQGPDGGVLCGLVHRNNARLILGASPNTLRSAAQLLRSTAQLPPGSPEITAARDAATQLGLSYDESMKLKAADSTLRASAA